MFSVVLAAAVAFVVTVALGSTFIQFLQSRKFVQLFCLDWWMYIVF